MHVQMFRQFAKHNTAPSRFKTPYERFYVLRLSIYENVPFLAALAVSDMDIILSVPFEQVRTSNLLRFSTSQSNATKRPRISFATAV